MHGSWRALVGRHDEANIKGGKPVTYLYKPFHPSHSRRYFLALGKTDQTTKRRMSETVTAAGASNSSPNENSARLESRTAENINLSPLLTLSQQRTCYARFALSGNSLPSFQKFAFHNCNVIFS